MIYVINTTEENVQIGLRVDTENNLIIPTINGEDTGFNISVTDELAKSVSERIYNLDDTHEWVSSKEVSRLILPNMYENGKLVYEIHNNIKLKRTEIRKTTEEYNKDYFSDVILVVKDSAAKVFVSPKTFGPSIYVSACDRKYTIMAYIPFRNKWNRFKQPAWISVNNKESKNPENINHSYQLTTFKSKPDNEGKSMISNYIRVVSQDFINGIVSTEKITKKSDKKYSDNK